ncbi:MAG: roadblock/LC7 domain-containing protein [Nitrospira sp.]|nr:roadblock/LC7 domain-containing protein [Nitrospira sp.]
MPLPDDHDTTVFGRELDSYLSNCDAVALAIVTTPDGRLCAQRQRGAYETEATAVMGSSLMALGDTILAELRLGTCESVIAESAQGLVLFTHIGSTYVLVSMTESKNSLGTLLSWARRTADDIAQALTTATINT